MRNLTPYAQNNNWAQRLEILAEHREEARKESTSGPSTIAQGPIVAQIQDETIVDIASLSDAELGAEGTALRADALTAPKEGI